MRPLPHLHPAVVACAALAVAILGASCAGGNKKGTGSSMGGGVSTTTTTSETDAGSSSSGTSSGTGGTGGAAGSSSSSSTSGASSSSTSGASSSSASTTTSSTSTSSTSCSTSTSSSSTSSSTSSSSGAPECTSSAQCSSGSSCLCGACSAPTLLLLGGSPGQNLLAGTFQAGSGWATTTLADKASFGPSLTADGNGCGVGVYASATAGNEVAATIWSGGAWGAPAVIAPSAVTRSTPSIDATASPTSHVVYQDATSHYWYLAHSDTWSSPQAIGRSCNPYFGPFAASITTRVSGPTVTFFAGAPDLTRPADTVTTTDLASGTWSAGATSSSATTPNVVGNGSGDVIPTAIITFAVGTQQLLVYVDEQNAIQVIRRFGLSAWSPPSAIGGTTDTPMALASVVNNDAILAFRGRDGNLYYSVYSFTTSAWSAALPFSTPNVTVDANTSPALTHGLGGDTAEIAYISGGQAYHASLTGSTWSAPVLVGGSGLTGVAIAATP